MSRKLFPFVKMWKTTEVYPHAFSQCAMLFFLPKFYTFYDHNFYLPSILMDPELYTASSEINWT